VPVPHRNALIRIGLEAVFAKAARENGPLMKMGGLRFTGDIHRNELIKKHGGVRMVKCKSPL
jgi:hypothetical protein